MLFGSGKAVRGGHRRISLYVNSQCTQKTYKFKITYKQTEKPL
ncbi:hypothetical protein Y023_5131 [Burkholderia pseudomallei A79D]|nr:hypothetical protein Y023_5131 [Burkholderia pseudomallei A79D]KGX97300.1 hypothetical protein X997_4814 [Burkholderia pseudomallei A79C]